MISRRHFLKLAGGGALGAASIGLFNTSCGGAKTQTTTSSSGPDEETAQGQQEEEATSKEEADPARLLARPEMPLSSEATEEVTTGLQPLGLGSERDGLLYVPQGYTPTEEAPIALMLHGTMGDAQSGISPFLDLADEAGLILLAPESRDPRDWDFVFPGYYGPDVQFIDQALEQTFDKLAVDAERLAIEGFSDGASYSLTLGQANGDLFTHVIAFSPGIVPRVAQRGKPSIFIAHGTSDEVLPIEATSRRRVRRLEREGYQVRYLKFDGGHTLPPPEVAQEAVDWFLAKKD